MFKYRKPPEIPLRNAFDRIEGEEKSMARIRFRAALAVLTLFALAVLAPGGAHAVSQARIFGSILDENKTPLAGVTIVVTCPEVPSLRLESKSDAAGKWAVTLVDSTKSHHYRFEKEGHQPM
jgi:hypothetical protein